MKTSPTERVIETGADAAGARRLVGLLRAAALAGGRHDPDLFDAAVLSQRRAQRQARRALASWADARTTDRPSQRAA